MVNALIKAAAIFCPKGKAVFKNFLPQTLTTMRLLKELQRKLDQNLEKHYMLGVQASLNKKELEAKDKLSQLSRKI